MTVVNSVRMIGRLATVPVSGIGKYVIFLSEVFKRTFYPPVRWKLLVRQMEFVGNQSFGIVLMAGAMIGGVFGFQLGEIFRIFGAESLLGAAASIALSKELAPVVGAFLVTGRAGSSMAAEIATMRVNEQIDAMRVMAVNPHNYLVAPRVLASMLMMPLLDAVFILSGVAVAFLVGYGFFRVDVGVFFEKLQWLMDMEYIYEGMQKSFVFGMIFSSIGCYKGYYARGGAKGVGRATTEAVVLSLVSILIADFFISFIQINF